MTTFITDPKHAKVLAKITNKEPLAAEDFAYLNKPNVFSTLDDTNRGIARFTYSDFINSLGTDKFNSTGFTNLQGHLVDKANSVQVDDNAVAKAFPRKGEDPNFLEISRKSLRKVAVSGRQEDMWIIYYHVMLSNPPDATNSDSHEKEIHDYDPAGHGGKPFTTEVNQAWVGAVTSAFQNVLGKGPFKTVPSDAGLKFRSAPPKAAPPAAGKSDVEVNDETEKQTLRVISQCILLHNLNSIATEYRDHIHNTLSSGTDFCLYNHLAYKIHSATPDTILNTLVLGSSNAGDVFGLKTGVELRDLKSKSYFKTNKKNERTLHPEYVAALKDTPTLPKNKIELAIMDNSGIYRSYKYENLVTNAGSFKYPWHGDAKFDIEFNGTNPSTARSDIKVNFDREVDNIANCMKEPFKNKTFEFISRQGENLSKSKTGFGKFYRNAYSYNLNRKTLFINLSSSTLNSNKGGQVSYGIDLSLVKHDLSLKNELAAADFKLEHRGFQESLLTSPYTDVIGGKELLKKRQTIENNIVNKMFSKSCSREDIQEAEDNFRTYNRVNLISFKNRLMVRMIELGMMSKFSGFVQATYETLYKTGEKIPNKATTSGTTSIYSVAKSATGIAKDAKQSTSVDSSGIGTVYFFQFGDFVNVAMEMFTKKGITNAHSSSLDQDFDDSLFSNFKPISLMAPFQFTPTGGTGKVTINIAELPISVDWYAKFMNDFYFSKGVEHIPIGQLFRDMLEVGISNMLSEVCFNGYLQKKLMFRVSNFKGTKKQYEEFRKISKPPPGKGTTAYTRWGTRDHLIRQNLSFPLFSSEPQVDEFYNQKGSEYYSYIFMHAQDPIESGASYQKNLFTKVDNKVIPVIRNLDSTQKPYLFVKSFDWSKTDNKYERERRYFNSNSFTPYVLGNVYNCTIKTTYMVPFLYPGMIVGIQPYLGTDDSKDFKQGKIDKTVGWELGLTGFYLITKIKHTVTDKVGDGLIQGETEIVCKNILSLQSTIEAKSNVRSKDCEKYVALSEDILLAGNETNKTDEVGGISTGQSAATTVQIEVTEEEKEEIRTENLSGWEKAAEFFDDAYESIGIDINAFDDD